MVFLFFLRGKHFPCVRLIYVNIYLTFLHFQERHVNSHPLHDIRFIKGLKVGSSALPSLAIVRV